MGYKMPAFAGAAKNLEEFVGAFFGIGAFRLPLNLSLPFPCYAPLFKFLDKDGDSAGEEEDGWRWGLCNWVF